jgi:hypothetical protein
MRQVLLYQDQGGFWIAECPSLPGCATQGRTKAEALQNIREAIKRPADGITSPLCVSAERLRVGHCR